MLILVGDLHLREDNPICRIDNFIETQIIKLQFIKNLQKQYDCPVIIPGDIFHIWKTSPYLLSIAMNNLPKNLWVVAGNHDLPQHNLSLLKKSGLFTLATSGHIRILNGTHFGQEPINESIIIGNKKILVWHNMTYQKIPFPGASGGMANKILRKYPQFDLIVTGDNHQSFVEEYQGRILVNPGSLTRQTADQIDFKPSVYLWHAENNSVERIFIPCQEGAISREHIERKEERDSRISAFISKLDSDWKAEMTFEENLEIFFQANNTREQIKELIYKAIE